MIKKLWETYLSWCEAFYEARQHYYKTNVYSRYL
jgi:hypothetical protein